MRWVRARDKAGRVLALPSQAPGVTQRYGLSREQLDREAWAIDPSGRRFAGAAAINRTLAELGGPWALLAAAYRVPPLTWFEDRVYRWIATHRHLFWWYSTRPACDEPDVACE